MAPCGTGRCRPARGSQIDERLLGHEVRVLVAALVQVGVERLGVAHEEVGHLGGVDEQAVAVDPAGELLQRLRVVVGADPGVDAVVPAVEPAEDVVSVDVAVGQQGATVEASSVEHGVLLPPADDDQVDPFDRDPGGHPLRNLGPRRHTYGSPFGHHLQLAHGPTVSPVCHPLHPEVLPSRSFLQIAPGGGAGCRNDGSGQPRAQEEPSERSPVDQGACSPAGQ